MRDLLNLIDNLEEARGLSARKPGEIYSRGEGADNQITFQSLTFYPEVGSFTSTEEMMTAFNSVQKKVGHPIEMVNQPVANKAFGIAAFDTAVGTRYLAKFAKEIKPVREKNTFFQTVDIPGEFSQTDARGSKEKVGYKPSDVLTEFKSQTPLSILAQIAAKFGESSDEYQAAVIITSAKSFPVSVPSGKMDFTGFRDYFCEMLQPVALVMGKPVKGNAQEASTIFFGPGQGYGDATISFNQGTTGGLYDSLLVSPDGKQIKLSSKGKSGANASVVNLLRSIEELQVAPKGKKLLEKHKDVVELLKIIEKGGHTGAALELGVKYKIITPEEAREIMTLKDKGPQDKINFKNKNLNKLYQSRTPKDWNKIVPLEHMLSVVAYTVADYVNKNTNFGPAAAEILNHSALVQMYTEATESADTITITGFRAIYPSETVTGVLLDATKAYMSTQGKGNFTFKILKNGAKSDDVNPIDGVDDVESSAKLSTADLDAETNKTRLTGPGAKASKQKSGPNFDVSVTGREQRKPR